MTEETGRLEYRFTTLEAAITAAWSDYKKHHDPPGCEGSEARAKAWAWHDAKALRDSLTPGEQLVWAAAFAHHVAGGTPAAIAARIATHRVQQLRELTTAEVDRVGAAADVSSSTVLAHIEQMRGGR